MQKSSDVFSVLGELRPREPTKAVSRRLACLPAQGLLPTAPAGCGAEFAFGPGTGSALSLQVGMLPCLLAVRPPGRRSHLCCSRCPEQFGERRGQSVSLQSQDPCWSPSAVLCWLLDLGHLCHFPGLSVPRPLVSLPSAGQVCHLDLPRALLGSFSRAGQRHSPVREELAHFVPFHRQGRGAS